MGTNRALLVANLFLFCYERELMMSLSYDKQANVIDVFNTMVSQIYPLELQLNKPILLIQKPHFRLAFVNF